jgi:hypothetical protein
MDGRMPQHTSRWLREREEEKAEQSPPGAEPEGLLHKAREADVNAHIDEWLTSPGLKTPT